MLNLLLTMIMLGILVLVLYFSIIFIIKIISGNSFSEVQAKFRRFFVTSNEPSIETNSMIFREFDMIIKDVLNETNYTKLLKRYELCVNTKPNGIYLYDFLPYFYFSYISSSDEEEIIITKSADTLVARYLSYYGYPPKTFTLKEKHIENGCNMAVVFFARNQEEYKRLLQFIRDKNVKEDNLRPSGEA